MNSYEDEVSDATNCRAECDNVPSLAISVREIGDQDAAEETDEVRWCCKSLCRDRVVTHVFDDSWQEVRQALYKVSRTLVTVGIRDTYRKGIIAGEMDHGVDVVLIISQTTEYLFDLNFVLGSVIDSLKAFDSLRLLMFLEEFGLVGRIRQEEVDHWRKGDGRSLSLIHI